MAESLANSSHRCERGFARSREGALPLFAKVAKQGGLTHIVYGEHPYEVSILYDG
jgi:hypothetical protein